MDYLIPRSSLAVLLLSGCGLVLDPGPPRQDERRDSGVPVDGSMTDAGDRDGAFSLDGSVDAMVDASRDGSSSDANSTDGGTPDATVCSAGETLCSGACVNTDSAANHCGRCNNVCQDDELCTAGSCGEGWIDVAAGAQHSCGLTSAGRVFCWGAGGPETGVDDSNPTFGARILDVTDAPLVVTPLRDEAGFRPDPLALGDGYSCLLEGAPGSGQVWCWGDTVVASSTSKANPVPNSTQFIEVAGGNHFVCAVKGAGTGRSLYCWGDNDHLQLGLLDPQVNDYRPQLVSSGRSYQGLGLGDHHGCFSGPVGSRCWGQGAHGQLGPNYFGNTDEASPGPPFQPRFTQTSGGVEHHCGRTSTGEVVCWGGVGTMLAGMSVTFELFEHQSGSELRDPQSQTLPGFAYDLGVGDVHGCAAVSQVGGDSAALGLYCWGFVPGSAGAVVPPAPLTIPSSELMIEVARNRVVDLAAGSEHSCAVFESGKLYCWGERGSPQLGCDTAGPSTDPACEIPIPPADP